MFEISICIPSFNQPESLEKTLSTLVSQDTKNVQILINDGNSDNKNLDVVNGFTKSLNIKYVKDPGRTIDTALLDLIEIADGKYIWWFGDDQFKEDAIKEAINCTKSDYDCIYVNGVLHNSNRLLVESNVKATNDKNIFLNAIGINIGFVSSFIFKKSSSISFIDKVRNFMIEEKKFVPSPTFSNVYILLHIIAKGDNFLFHSKPLFTCVPHDGNHFLKSKVRDSGIVLNDAFFVFGINMKDIFVLFHDQFDRALIKKLINDSFKSAWRGVIVGTAMGWDTTKSYNEFSKKLSLLKNYYNQPEIFLALPLFLLPERIVRFLYRIFKLIKA